MLTLSEHLAVAYNIIPMKLIKIFIGLTLFSLTVLPATSLSINPGGTGDIVAADSLAVEEPLSPDSLMEHASRAYKHLKWAKFEGEPDDSVYPAAWRCYEQTLEALAAVEPRGLQWAQCREILRDVDNDMLRGAYYYSNAGRSGDMNRFAQAYVDIQQLDVFRGEEWNRDPRMFPTIVYVAASGAYNDGDWNRAIGYFKVYFSTGDMRQRENVYMFMGKACLNAGEYALAIHSMLEASKLYPSNEQMLLIGIQACVDGGRAEHLQEFLAPALALKPADEQLLNLQGQLHEDENEYEKAIAVYSTLDEIRPNSLNVAKHIGLNYYNMAVNYYNMAINEKDDKTSRRYRRQAKNYFDAAADKLREVLASDPMAVKYIRSLGVCYLCLEDKLAFDKVNEQLLALGEDPLSNVFMPPIVSYSEDGKNFGRVEGAGRRQAEVPTWREFATPYIGDALVEWARKKEFEPMDEYEKRVNHQTIRLEFNRLKKECAEEYLSLYSGNLRLSDLVLKPYDATNQTFLIESSHGPIYLNVPLADGEAEMFKAVWDGVRLRKPTYYIDENGVRIASVKFVTPGGKTYSYDNTSPAVYTQPNIYIDFDKIIGHHDGQTPGSDSGNPVNVITLESDVDKDIPVTKKTSDNTLALVIANENYQNVAKVESALHDGSVFAEYCRLTLGLPEKNIILCKDATLGTTLRSINELRNKAGVLGSKADIIVYYAGHGMPDDATKDAYILPVDGDATVPETGYALSRLYKELGELDAQSVAVFIDACFSGARRDGEMLTMARSVVIKTKDADPKGNMFILSAASGEETALPYVEKNHGMFTYYLLKKLQESKGGATLRELSDYVIKNVKHQSNFVNNKPQTPTVRVSGRMESMWNSKKLRP